MKIQTKAWTNPRDGKVRHYINGGFIANYLGFAVINNPYEDTIHLLGKDGEKVPAGITKKILQAKLWIDENGKLQLGNFWAADLMTKEEALENAKIILLEEGGLDIPSELDEITITCETNSLEQQCAEKPIFELSADENEERRQALLSMMI